jgi:hypothetical protein
MKKKRREIYKQNTKQAQQKEREEVSDREQRRSRERKVQWQQQL